MLARLPLLPRTGRRAHVESRNLEQWMRLRAGDDLVTHRLNRSARMVLAV
jgi:hypothetical protein